MGSTVKISPFAPASLPEAPEIPGVRFATAEAGIRYKGRTDLLMAVLSPGTVAAGVTTRSKTCSAPVLWCRKQLEHGRARALVVNSGNANAFTGRKGHEAVVITAEAAAKAAGCAPEEVYLASTGVIGEPMDATRFAHLLGDLAATARPDRWEDAARAIMTTDTYPKLAVRRVLAGPGEVTLAGFCKGAGMIAPDMATMLAFIVTDADIAPPVLKALLNLHVRTTFNSVTVDGDTSTNDTALLFATGASGAPRIGRVGDRRLKEFSAALDAVMLDLAHQLVKDGEGATKFVKVTVDGAASPASARKLAKSIADSPLVKTAIAGEDANWGRIVMAVGKTEEAVDRDRLAIRFGPHVAAVDGAPSPTYDEAVMSAYMKNAEIDITVHVASGRASATVWTCDLTKRYIEINGDYRS